VATTPLPLALRLQHLLALVALNASAVPAQILRCGSRCAPTMVSNFAACSGVSWGADLILILVDQHLRGVHGIAFAGG